MLDVSVVVVSRTGEDDGNPTVTTTFIFIVIRILVAGLWFKAVKG